MNIIYMEVKRRTKSMLIWSAIVIMILVMFMALFPSFKDSGMQELIATKLNAMPVGLLEAMNISLIDFQNIVQYFAYCFQFVLMASCIYAALLGAGALVSEESEGTISFLYAKPVSRSKIVTSKLIGILIIFYLFIMITGLSAFVLCIIFKPAETNTMEMLLLLKTIFIYGFLIELIYLSLSFLISIALKTAKQATPVSIGVFFITYFFGIAGKLTDKASFLKYFSPFHYFEPAYVITANYEAEKIYILLTVLLIVCPIILSYIWYNKKDLRG